MLSRSYYLHQAQVCRSLANATAEPTLQVRYEKLMLDFLAKAAAADEGDPNDFLDFLTAPPKKPGSGDMSPEE
jgi:hypothetical protein